MMGAVANVTYFRTCHVMVLGTIIAFRIRLWIQLAALGHRMGWPRLACRAFARANRLQDYFLLLGFENDVKEAINRQAGANIRRPPDAYSVIGAGNAGFQVIEAPPDGGEPRVVVAFATRAAAAEWLSGLTGN